MKILASSQVMNTVSINDKMNSFKHHLISLQKIQKKNLLSTKKQNKQSLSFKINYPTINSKPIRLPSQNSQQKQINKYQKQKQIQIQKENKNLLKKMLRIEKQLSEYSETQHNDNIRLARNNLMITNYNNRLRTLSQTQSDNLRLSGRLFRCKSSYKFNSLTKGSLLQNNQNAIRIRNNNSLLKVNYNKIKSINHPLIDYRLLAKQQLMSKRLSLNGCKLTLK